MATMNYGSVPGRNTQTNADRPKKKPKPVKKLKKGK